MFAKKRKLGRAIDMLKVGEKLEMSKKIEDKEILLYLGFTDDSNPIYIQHDYASRTPYEKPIVPHGMINGFLSSAVSMHLPGPGSVIKKMTLTYPKPLYHYGTLHLSLEVTNIDAPNHLVHLSVRGADELNEEVISGEIEVAPPYPWKPMTFDAGTFENF
ncbi:Acyl dehydratase [Evansella caseinilytica]|uniref:Acyl dehydratase n=1 Tax=Evansella caseinilytica TaxID=1503961 RepID=A0A1H3TWE1_9BACI|nr:MaoC/PaaZ C-terminal domain-containing protein [Evansella caseinilytica]SDZ54368.1 Acyl dehydratase [Evansella caseinilytica]